MIIGSCPYEDCDGPLFLPIAQKCPAFQRHLCETCNRPIWTRHSRWDPWSTTEAEFLAEYEVDEATQSVELRRVVQDKEGK